MNIMQKKKFVIFGLGYVGLSNAVLLARQHHVIAIDIDESKISMVNKRISPIVDSEITEYLNSVELDLTATKDLSSVLDADYIIVATPTNYDERTHFFDTSSVEQVIDSINSTISSGTKSQPSRLPLIIIKSTIPIGFVQGLKNRGIQNVLFMPEFLREGKALYDNLHPSRIVVGEKSNRGQQIANIYASASLDPDVPVVLTGPTEAESIKLFANSYLAMRISYINEIDTFSERNNLNTKDIIEGITLDPRIGQHYRNPSFGYGGYCLPKDTKQLLANFISLGVPQNLIEAIVESNKTRLNWIVKAILDRKPRVVGLYRLIMKSNSDNFRSSAMLQILNRLKLAHDIKIIIYEPTLSATAFEQFEVCNDLSLFKSLSDVVCANRIDENLDDVSYKVYTRDIYHMN